MNQNYNRKVENTRKKLKVSDLPLEERPRERLLRLGPEFLSSQELLAIIISSGVAGIPATELAQILISRYGSLAGIADVSAEELKKEIKGMGNAKITRLKACFEIARRIENERKQMDLTTKDRKITSPQYVFGAIKSKLLDYKREHFFVLSLNSHNKIIAIDEISTGILDASLVHPREVFDTAIRRRAAKIIIAHNHPSGDSEPSEDDINITRRLKEAGTIIGIELIDHIIVCRNSFFSFKEKDLIE